MACIHDVRDLVRLVHKQRQIIDDRVRLSRVRRLKERDNALNGARSVVTDENLRVRRLDVAR